MANVANLTIRAVVSVSATKGSLGQGAILRTAGRPMRRQAKHARLGLVRAFTKSSDARQVRDGPQIITICHSCHTFSPSKRHCRSKLKFEVTSTCGRAAFCVPAAAVTSCSRSVCVVACRRIGGVGAHAPVRRALLAGPTLMMPCGVSVVCVISIHLT